MTIETERLLLRPWRDEDAPHLYEYAKDDRIGPIAGWPPHTSLENSLEILRTVLSAPEVYAVVPKAVGHPVGSVGIMFGKDGSAPMSDGEAEIGYWIGVPFWGQGLIPEAARALLARCFDELDCTAVWCGWFDGNEKSRRVQAKCGFRYHHTTENMPCELMGDVRTELFSRITREQWREDALLAPLHSGALYVSEGEDILRVQAACLERLYDYNATRPSEGEKRAALLREMLAEVGEGCYIEPPFHANWGGKFVHFGDHVYANFNLTLVDDTHIYVGDGTLFGPNVTLDTGTHPVAPALRAQGLQYNRPIRIGKNCWIGAGAVVLPGVTIGDNAVIGAGSVVTHDVPPNVVAVGVPCRVLRTIEEQENRLAR